MTKKWKGQRAAGVQSLIETSVLQTLFSSLCQRRPSASSLTSPVRDVRSLELRRSVGTKSRRDEISHARRPPKKHSAALGKPPRAVDFEMCPLQIKGETTG